MSKEVKEVIAQITAILVRENQITLSEQARVLELLKDGKAEG